MACPGMRQILFSLLLPLLVLPGCGGSSTSGELPRLMVERLGWMDQVARAKQARSLPVDDPDGRLNCWRK